MSMTYRPQVVSVSSPVVANSLLPDLRGSDNFCMHIAFISIFDCYSISVFFLSCRLHDTSRGVKEVIKSTDYVIFSTDNHETGS